MDHNFSFYSSFNKMHHSVWNFEKFSNNFFHFSTAILIIVVFQVGSSTNMHWVCMFLTSFLHLPETIAGNDNCVPGNEYRFISHNIEFIVEQSIKSHRNQDHQCKSSSNSRSPVLMQRQMTVKCSWGGSKGQMSHKTMRDNWPITSFCVGRRWTLDGWASVASRPPR